MEIIFRTFVQVAITTKVIAINFEDIIKSLPTDIPEDFKSVMLDMFAKQPQNFDMPNLDDVTLMDLKTATHSNSESSRSMTVKTTPKLTSVTKLPKPTKATVKIMRTGNTDVNSTPNNCALPRKVTPTLTPAPPPTEGAGVLPPPSFQQQQIPPKIVIPIYPRVPVMIPMRTYFEPVFHDHPPLYKIKEMIEKDEKKWNKEKHCKDCEFTVEIGTNIDSYSDKDSDTDTDSSSDYKDEGSDYYDSFIRIHKGDRK